MSVAMAVRETARVEFHVPADTGDEFAGAAGVVRFLDIPPRRMVMIDGAGRPLPEELARRIPGLYGTAWGLRFTLKARGIDTKVRPLEGFWWTTNGSEDLSEILDGGRTDWHWTLAIPLPDVASHVELLDAIRDGRAKLDDELAPALRLETLDEGRVVQVLHVGPYAAERPAIERLHAAIAEAGLRPDGRHHEIYLGDPRRSAPDRRRTIVRQPVA